MKWSTWFVLGTLVLIGVLFTAVPNGFADRQQKRYPMAPDGKLGGIAVGDIDLDTNDKRVLLDLGSAAAPSLACPDTDTGIHCGNNVVYFGANGTYRAMVTSSGLTSDAHVTVGLDLIVNGEIYIDHGTTTLGVGATTFAVNANGMTITGDGGGNTIGTITGVAGTDGMDLVLVFADANVTITDTAYASATTDQIALEGAATNFTSGAGKVLALHHNGTFWVEVGRRDLQ